MTELEAILAEHLGTEGNKLEVVAKRIEHYYDTKFNLALDRCDEWISEDVAKGTPVITPNEARDNWYKE